MATQEGEAPDKQTILTHDEAPSLVFMCSKRKPRALARGGCHLKVSKRKLKKLDQTVGEIVERYRVFQLKSVRFFKFINGPELSFRISKPPILAKLNKEVVESCEKLRNGVLFLSYKKRVFPKLDRSYIEKYGTYWSVGKNFHPHFTMVRYVVPSDGPKMIKKMAGFNF